MKNKKILLIDNFDSFTYNLADYVRQSGVSCEVFRNNVPLSEIQILNYQGVIFSPGPETPQKAGNLMQFIENFYDKLPILGVCLGHQALGEFFGAELTKAIKPMHGKISEIHCNSNKIFKDTPSKIKVVRYHSLILKSIPANLDIIAETNLAEVMAFQHKNLPIWGLQFHPEAALTAYGLQMIKNWTDFCSC